MKPLTYVIALGLVAASLGAFVTQWNVATRLRQENERLKGDLATAQRLARVTANDPNARRSQELERLRTEAGEIHKLRNEVSQLRAGARELDKLRAENQQLRGSNQRIPVAPNASPGGAPATAAPEAFYPKENWAFAGYATPEAALQSVVWAMREGDTKTFLASVTPEEMARMEKEWGNKSEAQISADARKGADKISSVRILERKVLSDDEVVLSLYAEGGDDKIQKISMKRFGAEWKLAGPKRD